MPTHALAVSIVGAAIAAALAAAGPVVLSVCKWRQQHTVLGVVAGGALVAAGALGELWVVAVTGTGLDNVTGTADTFIWLAAGGAASVLIVYLVRNTVDVVKEGKATPPGQADPAIVAAAVQAGHCCENGPLTVEEIVAAFDVADEAVKARADKTGTPAAELSSRALRTFGI